MSIATVRMASMVTIVWVSLSARQGGAAGAAPSSPPSSPALMRRGVLRARADC